MFVFYLYIHCLDLFVNINNAKKYCDIFFLERSDRKTFSTSTICVVLRHGSMNGSIIIFIVSQFLNSVQLRANINYYRKKNGRYIHWVRSRSSHLYSRWQSYSHDLWIPYGINVAECYTMESYTMESLSIKGNNTILYWDLVNINTSMNKCMASCSYVMGVVSNSGWW